MTARHPRDRAARGGRQEHSGPAHVVIDADLRTPPQKVSDGQSGGPEVRFEPRRWVTTVTDAPFEAPRFGQVWAACVRHTRWTEGNQV
jgi:hypothetical protein